MNYDPRVQVLAGILMRLERLERIVTRMYDHQGVAEELHDIRADLNRELCYDWPRTRETQEEIAQAMLNMKSQNEDPGVLFPRS